MKKLLLILALSLPCSAQILLPIMQGAPAAGGSTWARVGSNGTCLATTSVSTSFNCTFGSTPANGEFIVIVVTGQPSSGTATISGVDANGNAMASTEASPIPSGCISSGANGGAILYLKVGAGLASGAFTISTTGFNATLTAVGRRYTGGTGTLTQHNCTYSAANATTCPGGSATISTSGSSLVVGGCGELYANTPDTSITSSGSWADVGQQFATGSSNSYDTFMQDQINVGAATYQVQANVNWNGAGYEVLIASFN